MIPFFPVLHNPRILIIDNDDSFTFNLVQLVREWGKAEYTVIRSKELDPDIAGGFGKVLISPGPGLPSDFPGMIEVIRIFGERTDILGICLGHQAIALEYGGTLINLPVVRHGTVCRLKILKSDESLFKNVKSGSPVGLYHSWSVDPETLPDCLEITAISDDETILAIRHIRFKIKGLQFHPESFMTLSGKQMIHNWLEGGGQ